MSWPPRRYTAGLRDCPTCDSTAISELEAEDLSPALVQLRVRCGECEGWRIVTLGFERARTVERRIERMLARDRRRIQDDLRRVKVGGIEIADFVPSSDVPAF